jgi:hypothetical protein
VDVMINSSSTNQTNGASDEYGEIHLINHLNATTLCMNLKLEGS